MQKTITSTVLKGGMSQSCDTKDALTKMMEIFNETEAKHKEDSEKWQEKC